MIGFPAGGKLGMPLARFLRACSLIFLAYSPLSAGPDTGTLAGIVTFNGTPPKRTPFDLAKEPACVKMHASDPLLDETIVTGRGNGLANVVVYISAGDTETNAVPANPVTFEQRDCHYRTHVLAVQVGQEIKILNSDPISHNIHPLAKVNREWNRMEPPGTPAFSYSYDKDEFISVKCNLHPWMHGYFVVLKTSHFAVTAEDGVFRLPDLPQGKYTVTAWHESLGTQTQEIVVNPGETTSIYFSFPPKS
jgi:plastocyanin